MLLFMRKGSVNSLRMDALDEAHGRLEKGLGHVRDHGFRLLGHLEERLCVGLLLLLAVVLLDAVAADALDESGTVAVVALLATVDAEDTRVGGRRVDGAHAAGDGALGAFAAAVTKEPLDTLAVALGDTGFDGHFLC